MVEKLDKISSHFNLQQFSSSDETQNDTSLLRLIHLTSLKTYRYFRRLLSFSRSRVQCSIERGSMVHMCENICVRGTIPTRIQLHHTWVTPPTHHVTSHTATLYLFPSSQHRIIRMSRHVCLYMMRMLRFVYWKCHMPLGTWH